MQLCYILPSPTFGMHQYTADMANRMVAAGHQVSLVTSTLMPSGRYAPEIAIYTPISTSNTGFSREGLNFGQHSLIIEAVLQAAPDVIHFTGPHLWNINLVRRLRGLGYPVVHTIHDLIPHKGMRMGSFLGLWNRLIVREADHVLVHGQLYRQKLLHSGLQADKVTFTPLLHLFVGYEKQEELRQTINENGIISYEPFALFFGRLQPYKGIEQLLAACAKLTLQDNIPFKLVIAGQGDISSFWRGKLPHNVIVQNRFIGDDAAVDLFRRCSLLVLPYTDATQSALVAAAYYFSKPVLVTRSGALTEYVADGRTGFIVEPDHPLSLASKLQEAFASPDRLQKMGQAGRKWYETNRRLELSILQSLYERCQRRQD